MSECVICALVQQKKDVVFESEHVVALLAPQPAANGQMMVTSRKHAPIIETVPDFVVAEMFQVANKVGTVVFDALGAQGTNVLVQNGPAAGQRHKHVSIQVIPRFEGDRLQIGWNPKPGSEEELAKVQSALLEETKNVGVFEMPEEKPIELQEAAEVPQDDYRSKQLRRIP